MSTTMNMMRNDTRMESAICSLSEIFLAVPADVRSITFRIPGSSFKSFTRRKNLPARAASLIVDVTCITAASPFSELFEVKSRIAEKSARQLSIPMVSIQKKKDWQADSTTIYFHVLPALIVDGLYQKQDQEYIDSLWNPATSIANGRELCLWALKKASVDNAGMV